MKSQVSLTVLRDQPNESEALDPAETPMEITSMS